MAPQCCHLHIDSVATHGMIIDNNRAAYNYDEIVKNHRQDGKVKSSSSRRREFRGMRRTDVRRSEHQIKRNAEIGLFTKPSIMNAQTEKLQWG